MLFSPRSMTSLSGLTFSVLAFAVAADAQHLETLTNQPVRQVPGGSGAQSALSGHTRGPFVSVQANVDAAGNNISSDAANEPSIVIDPKDSKRIVIGWRQFATITSNFRENGRSLSLDGGSSWAFPGPIEPGVFNSDPVLDADSAGNLYYLSYPSGRTLKLFASTDGGHNWSLRSRSTGGDKAWMIIDRTASIGRDNIYYIWQVVHGPNTFSRSLDGGQTFQTPVAVVDTPTFGTLAIDAAGTLYSVGLVRQNRSSFVMARSTNAKDPNQTPSFQTYRFSMGGSMGFALAPNPGGLMGQVQVAVDPVRPNYVYALCSVTPSGNDPMDLHIVRSIDGGQTFGSPVRINDDSVGNNAWQWFGTMSIAPNGRIDTVWNDTRNGGGSAILSETYYSFSLDAGSTWSRNIPVSTQWNSVIGHPNQAKIGDYYHMLSDGAAANLAYATTFNGEQDVYYLRLGDCNTNGLHDSTDLSNGTSFDSNANTIPDECEFCQRDLGFGSSLELLVCGDDLTAAGSRATLQVGGGPASRPVFLLFSTTRLSPPLPLGGGAALVPDPNAGFTVSALSSNANGYLGVTIKGGAGNAITVYVQAAMLDPNQNLLVSNAVEVRLGT